MNWWCHRHSSFRLRERRSIIPFCSGECGVMYSWVRPYRRTTSTKTLAPNTSPLSDRSVSGACPYSIRRRERRPSRIFTAHVALDSVARGQRGTRGRRRRSGVPASRNCGDSVNSQRVFVSGVAGFLGSHLADAFLADGHHVVGIDNMLGGELANVPVGVEFYEIDCNDWTRVRTTMKGVDVVFHCAATPYEGGSVFSPHLVTQNIVTATSGMISAAISQRVRQIV